MVGIKNGRAVLLRDFTTSSIELPLCQTRSIIPPLPEVNKTRPMGAFLSGIKYGCFMDTSHFRFACLLSLIHIIETMTIVVDSVPSSEYAMNVRCVQVIQVRYPPSP